MITEYPIHIDRDFSRLSNAQVHLTNKELYEYCSKIEDWVNKRIKEGKTGTIHYSTINDELYLPEGLLGKVILIDGGSTGFTIADEVTTI